MGYQHCIARLNQAAGRELTDAEVRTLYERIHKAALDIKAGRGEAKGGDAFDDVVSAAAREAAAQLIHDAEVKAVQAQWQLVKMSGRVRELRDMIGAGIDPLNAVERTIARHYDGRYDIESLEQRAQGLRDYFKAKLLPAWDALGNDFAGFFQDRAKLLNLIRELRGEETGDVLAKNGAKAFHDAAEEARATFNSLGGDIGRLDDWGMPQHHSQIKVATAGREAWVGAVLPLLDRSRYVDDAGQAWSDTTLRAFLGRAWDNIATDGLATRKPGEIVGEGKRANRHAEHRQIHFKDADSHIAYWEQFGDNTAVEILSGHIETMARDIAFIDKFGPNPNTTYRVLRDMALQTAATGKPTDTEAIKGRAVKLDILYDYAAGRIKPSANQTLSRVADAIAHLNVAGKLGGATLASLFGDKPMMEAVAHLNRLPLLQRWRTELALFNPANAADRRLLQQQGLMLDSVRSGLARFYEGLGQSSTTGRIANAVMRLSGMQAVNDIRKGAFGASLMASLGEQIAAGKGFADLAKSDMRLLKSYGITADDWAIWQKATLQDLGHGNTQALTPEAISRIDGIDAAKKRDAIVKLLGAINTESEFAIVTPGWKERAAFYGDLQRGTLKGEVVRGFLQFKSFPWAMFHRMADAVANKDAPVGKAAMSAYLIAATTLAGAMLIQVRDMLAGKDPRDTTTPEFWGAAFLQGGALGIYGDFIYGAGHTRYGSGVLESVSGPTLGPLLELGLVQPIQAIAKAREGKETHFLAQEAQDLKGFVPFGNLWYTKAALDHLVFQQIFEALSPGYLDSIRQRTAKEYNQDWWWTPGELTPERAPDLEAMGGR